MFHNAALKRTALTPYDWGLVFAALSLLMIGLVMVYSASIAIAEAKSAANQQTFYLIRHAMYLVIALGAGYAALQIPIQAWQTLAPYLFIAGAACLVLVLIPFVGKEVNGSRRWIPLGPRRRPRRQRREAVLPARGAHRLPARGDRRGTRLPAC
jgi:cell division protein FtsW